MAATDVLASGAQFSNAVSVAPQAGWYDFRVTVASDPVFQRQFAGHLETGRASSTDPVISYASRDVRVNPGTP